MVVLLVAPQADIVDPPAALHRHESKPRREVFSVFRFNLGVEDGARRRSLRSAEANLLRVKQIRMRGDKLMECKEGNTRAKLHGEQVICGVQIAARNRIELRADHVGGVARIRYPDAGLIAHQEPYRERETRDGYSERDR